MLPTVRCTTSRERPQARSLGWRPKLGTVKSLAALLVGAVLVLGPGKWEAPTPGRFEVWLPGSGDFSAMRVALQDGTGLVVGMSAGGRSGPDAVAIEPGQPNALVVSFVTGRCEDYALFIFRGSESGYRLAAVTETTPLHGGTWCSLLDGLGRRVTLTFSIPIDLQRVHFETSVDRL